MYRYSITSMAFDHHHVTLMLCRCVRTSPTPKKNAYQQVSEFIFMKNNVLLIALARGQNLLTEVLNIFVNSYAIIYRVDVEQLLPIFHLMSKISLKMAFKSRMLSWSDFDTMNEFFGSRH